MLRKRKLVIVIPAVGIAGSFLLLILVFLVLNWFGRTPNVFGLREGPSQPIAFSHVTHTSPEKAGIDCAFCHRNVTEGAAAMVPAVEQCMICHKVIGTGNPEVEKVRAAWTNKEPITWVRVHRLPDHVRFIHEAHLTFFAKPENFALMEQREDVIDLGRTTTSTVCSVCHGDVATMEKVKQVKSLKMGDCVDCHRQYSAPTDCSTCHY